jgi:hypothetical protein
MTPVAFYLAGLATHSSYERNTAFLAAEAVVEALVGMDVEGRRLLAMEGA